MASINPPLRVSDSTSVDGRSTTFAEFYGTHYARAVRLAVVLSGSASAAEDLVQDVMSDAHRRWRDLAGYDAPEAWLRRAIVNRAISRRRRAAVATRGLLRLTARARLSLELGERDWELWRHVRALPARQAQMIALVYVEGLTLEGAATVLGISLPTAKSHLARAKHRLEEDLADWRQQ